MAARFFLLCAFAFLFGAKIVASANAATVDVIEAGAAQNHFYIQPSYDGTSIALFGSVDATRLKAQPFDIVVTFRGPPKAMRVWRKARRFGVFVNAESVTFDIVPNYYAVLSTKPLAKIASFDERKRHEIGFDALPFSSNQNPESPPGGDEFRDALIGLKLASGLFVEDNSADIEFLGERLFRTRLFLPPAAGAGIYQADFYVFQNGDVVGEASALIQLDKIGIEARLSSAAIDHPWLYGLFAVILATAIGGGASLIFKKR